MVDVSLVKCASYDDRAVMASVKRAVDLIGGIRRFAKKGEKILLKPNILYGKPPEAAVTTHPAVLKSVARLVMSAGAMPSVGESSGGPISTVKSAKKAGIIDACEELGIPFIEFRRNRRRKIPEGALMKAFDIAGELEDFNGVISIPKLKTHTFQTLTGAIKNTFGCVPGMKKIELHVRMQDRELFASMLLDLHLLIDPRLNVMDGIMGMEGMGPGAGDPIKAGLISASSSGVAMDYVIAKAVKIPEKHIFVLKEARKRALLDDISVKGETPESFGVSFRYPQSYKGSLVRTTGIKPVSYTHLTLPTKRIV